MLVCGYGGHFGHQDFSIRNLGRMELILHHLLTAFSCPPPCTHAKSVCISVGPCRVDWNVTTQVKDS